MGVGDSWGTREELLHPRDSKGRFRSKWKMSTAAMDRVLKVLSTFAPKTWPSDQEAASYVSTLAPKKPVKLPLDNWAQMQADIRAGKGSKDLAMYEATEYLLPEDLILTSVMDAKAFGLTPETLGQMEEYTGKLVANKGPTSTNVGTPVGPGQVTLSIAAPKGTRAVIPGGGSREVILSAEQPLRITKVDPDGKGGFYVYATAMPKGAKGETRTKKLGTRAPTPTDPDGDGIPGVAPGAPAAPGAAPADPNAPQPRVEQIQSPAVGGDGAPAADEVTPGAPDSPDTSPAPPSGKPEPATPEQGTPQGEPRVVPREPGTELTEFDKEVQRLAAEELAKRIEARAGGGGDSGGSNGAPGNAPSSEGDTPAPAKKAAKKAAPTPEESADLDRQVAQAERRKKAETREAIRPGAGAARREANDKMMAERKRQAEAPQEDDPDARALVDAAGQDMPDDPFLKMAIGLTAVQVKNGQLSRKKGADRIRELADGRPDKEKNTLRAVADQIEKQSAPKRAPKAAAPAKKATPETPAREVPDQVRADLGTATVGELRQIAKDEGVKIPSSVRRKADIRDLIQAQRDADKGPEVPAKKALAKKAVPTKASPIDRVTTRLVDRLGEIDPAVRDEILKDLDPSVRREIDAARERVEGGASSVPAPAKKAPAKKVTAPVRSRDLDAERPKETPEQEKARVRDIVDTIKKENGTDWAGLAEVRRRMGGTRQEQDATLRRLARQEGVSVIPAANLKALRGEDHDAAIVIGEQANHVISFEDPLPAPARDIRREPGVVSSNLDPLIDAPEALGGGQVPFGELRERAREAGIHVPVYITAKEARAFLEEELAKKKTASRAPKKASPKASSAPKSKTESIDESKYKQRPANGAVSHRGETWQAADIWTRPGLTERENDAALSYTDGDIAVALNESLRGMDPDRADRIIQQRTGGRFNRKTLQEALDSAIQASELTEDTELWRGTFMTPEDFARLTPGTRVRNPGYSSTASRKGGMEKVMDLWPKMKPELAKGKVKVYHRYLAPKGTKALGAAGAVDEMVLGREVEVDLVRIEPGDPPIVTWRFV